MDILELGKTPITGDNPAGDDVRYDSDFETLQKELDKLSMATSNGAGIDWPKVIKLSSAILAEKSKNIQVATYLAAGLLETGHFQGLSQGLTVINDLVDNFWESMYPPLKRLRGRLNSISWWSDRVTSYLQGYNGDPLPADQVRLVKEMFRSLDQTLSEKTEDAPVLNRLVEFADRLPLQQEAAPGPAEADDPTSPPASVQGGPEVVAPASTPTAPAVPASAATPRTTPIPSAPDQAKPHSSQEARLALDDNLTNLARISWYLMEQDPANPLPYHLTRTAAWVTVDQLPMSNAGRTMLPPPDGLIRSGLDSLMAAKDYSGVVIAAEARVTEYLFWLDLSRISAQALDELGGRYEAARDAVMAQSAMFVRRLPGLEKLTFNDGTPFADNETKAWLKSMAGGAGDQAVPVSGQGMESEAAETLSQALGLVKDKKAVEAVTLLENRLTESGSARARLVWRLSLVRLLLNLARPDLARPHLKAITAQIDDFRVEEWEPKLAFQALRLVYEGLTAADDEAGREGAREIADRLAGLSPSETLNIFRA
jgi:type VI secretion system protein VasJ